MKGRNCIASCQCITYRLDNYGPTILLCFVKVNTKVVVADVVTKCPISGLWTIVPHLIRRKVCGICHDRDRTYPYTPYPDLSTPIPSHLNHSRAPNAKPEPSDPLMSQQCTPEHSDSLASSQCIPDPMHLRPFLSLASSRFPTTTLIPDPTPFNLLSSCVKSIPDTHTHSRPDTHSTFPLPCVKSIPDNHTYSRPDAI